MDYYQKYLKYKSKYRKLKILKGGTGLETYLRSLNQSGEDVRLMDFFEKLSRKNVQKLVVVGGSFNPMTKAHITICLKLLLQGYGVIIMPVHQSYKKVHMTKNEVRLSIIRKIIEIEKELEKEVDFDNLFLSTLEIDQDQQLTTGQTMELIYHLEKEAGYDVLPRFFIGADNVKYLCTWTGLDKLSYFPILAMYRPGEEILQDEVLREVYKKRVECNYQSQKDTLDRIVENLRFIEIDMGKYVNPVIKISELSSTIIRKAILSLDPTFLSALYGYDLKQGDELFTGLISLYLDDKSFVGKSLK